MVQTPIRSAEQSLEHPVEQLAKPPVEQPVQSIPESTHEHQNQPSLETLVQDIEQFEAIARSWDEPQWAALMGYKRAIEALHREALVRLIRSVKQDSLPALRRATEDPVVYGVLRYYELVKPPRPPLEQRLQQALAEVRPGLQSHQGDVELVAIVPPDTVEIRLIGACSHCPASSLTLTDGVEATIRRYCPEITRVVAVTAGAIAPPPPSNAPSSDPSWLEVTSLAEVPTQGVLAMKLQGQALLLSRIGSDVVCYRNACSHLGLPLDSGSVHTGILTCPSHQFRYRLESGECLTAPDLPLQRYPVQVQNGQVFVQLEGQP